MKQQNNFTITVFSNTAETAKARFKADIKIFNYGSEVSLSDTNIYKADSIDDLQSELYYQKEAFKKEYGIVRNFKSELKAKIEEGQTESFSFAFRHDHESYVVMILEDESGRLVGHMRHVSCRNDKGRYVPVSLDALAKRRSKLATSVPGEWVDGDNGGEFNVSFFVGNKATIKLTKDKNIASKKEEVKATVTNTVANDDIMKRFAEMEARLSALEAENKELKARVAELEKPASAPIETIEAANDDINPAKPSLTIVNGIRADLVETLRDSFDLNLVNEHLEKEITGDALTMDDMAVILRGDLAEIGRKYAVKGTRAERDREWGELIAL